MAEGFIPVESEKTGGITAWIAGVPAFGFLGRVKTDGKTAYRVRTFRCVKCARLESYAPDKI